MAADSSWAYDDAWTHISASFHHGSRRDNLSSDTAREAIRKVSFKPTSRGSSHPRPGRHLPARREMRDHGTIPPTLVQLAGNVRAWPVAEADAIIAVARGERILPEPRRPYRKPASPRSPGKPALPSRCGAMEKRKPSAISG